MSAHNWLKHYVYLRQLDNNKKGGFNFRATFITFIMSAIWHGFYPGYYIFFTGAGLMDYHAKVAEKFLSPYFTWMPSSAVFTLCYVWCYMGCSYFAIGFALLSFEKFHVVYLSMYYYFHVLLIGSIVLFVATMPKRGKDKSKTE